jgi:hypothetical protein|tara:strand:+ start:84 stop:233 length:150 start_codon:yes stop_codon:yes gene_type:complete
MGYLDSQKQLYENVLKIIDKKISKGKGIKSIRKHIIKKIKELEYFKSYE